MREYEKVINAKLDELDKLAEEHPVNLPLVKVAQFLGMNRDGLMAALLRHNTPFGFGYQKDDKGYRVPVIPTATFALWYTNQQGRMVMATDGRVQCV